MIPWSQCKFFLFRPKSVFSGKTKKTPGNWKSTKYTSRIQEIVAKGALDLLDFVQEAVEPIPSTVRNLQGPARSLVPRNFFSSGMKMLNIVHKNGDLTCAQKYILKWLYFQFIPPHSGLKPISSNSALDLSRDWGWFGNMCETNFSECPFSLTLLTENFRPFICYQVHNKWLLTEREGKRKKRPVLYTITDHWLPHVVILITPNLTS